MIYCYHHTDLDGISAAAMLRLSYPIDVIEFIPTNYPVKFAPDQFESYTEDDVVYFLDISFTEKDATLVEDLTKKPFTTYWIDHHKGSIDLINYLYQEDEDKDDEDSRRYGEFYKYGGWWVENRLYVIIDTTHCGATLTYQYLTQEGENSCPGFLKMIEAWDIHKTHMPYFEEAKDFLFGVSAEPDLSPEHKIWKELMTGGSAVLHMYVEKGRMLRNFSQLCNNQILAKSAVETEIFGIRCLAVNHSFPIANSMMFDEVKKIHPYPLYMSWHFDGKRYKYSIYTEDTSVVDCNAIAKRFGGGGHVGAAGFFSDQLLFVTNAK